MKRKILFFFLLFFMMLNTEAQCAMCRAVLESGEDQSIAEGVNNGIVYLMVFPYVLVGTLAFVIYKVYKKPKKEDVIK